MQQVAGIRRIWIAEIRDFDINSAASSGGCLKREDVMMVRKMQDDETKRRFERKVITLHVSLL